MPDETVQCTCGMEGLHNDPFSRVLHSPLCAKFIVREGEYTDTDEELAMANARISDLEAHNDALESQSGAWQAETMELRGMMGALNLQMIETNDALIAAEASLASTRRDLEAHMDAAKVREASLAESRGEVERLRALIAEMWDEHGEIGRYYVPEPLRTKILAALEAPHEST